MIMSLNFGIPKNINFPFGTNGNLLFICAPILKHIMVCYSQQVCEHNNKCLSNNRILKSEKETGSNLTQISSIHL